MKMTASTLNKFLVFKLPSAFLCGVRVKHIDNECCEVTVRHRWINQNPFKSMYFAVQAMAAELSTGALVMQILGQSDLKISMLVAANNSKFTKKAIGKITFVCTEGQKVNQYLQEAIASNEGQSFWMKSIGTNESGDVVSEMNFEWSIKIKSK